MLIILLVQFCVAALMFFAVHLIKHWKLLLLPRIFIEFKMTLEHEDIAICIVINYLCYFCGNIVGSLMWRFLSGKISKHSCILLSLFGLALFNFLQAVNNNFQSLLLFRFLTGVSVNFENMNKAFVHSFFFREHRQKAFFTESASNTLGTLTAPLVGIIIYHRSETFRRACFALSAAIVVLAVAYIFAFVHNTNESEINKQKNRRQSSSNSISEDEAQTLIPIKTISIPNWKSTVLYIIYENPLVKSLLAIYLINASLFHVGLVLTSSFLTIHCGKNEFTADDHLLAIGNLLGGFASIVGIYFLSMLDKHLLVYRYYMMLTILVNALSLMICPFLKILITSFSNFSQEIIFYAFYIFKESVSYYFYSHLLHHMINRSINKIHRLNLNFMIVIVKATFHGVTFILVLWLLLFTLKNKTMKEIWPFNYAVSFWLIAAVQLATLSMFKKIELPLLKASI